MSIYREVADRLVGGVKSRCFSVRLSRIVEELALMVDSRTSQPALVRALADAFQVKAPDGCEVMRLSNHRVYVRCCAESRDGLVEKFEEVVKLAAKLVTGHGSRPS